MQENQDWQNRGSGIERRGGAVIVSGKMVWQQLIRLAELWLSNEHPPLWQSSHYAVNHEHTLIRFSIASLCRNQIKEHQNGTKTQEREGGKMGKLKTLWGSFIHVWTLWITGFLPLIHEYLSTRKCVSAISIQSLPGRLSVFQPLCLCNRRLPPRLQSDSEQSSTSTQFRLMPSTVRINCLALSRAAQKSQIPCHHGGWVKMFSRARSSF